MQRNRFETVHYDCCSYRGSDLDEKFDCFSTSTVKEMIKLISSLSKQVNCNSANFTVAVNLVKSYIILSHCQGF